MTTVDATLQDFFTQHAYTGAYWVALSGGVDSCVLLHAAARLAQEGGLIIEAIHVNHHISSQANLWQQHCEQLCRELSVPLVVADVAVPRESKNGLEAAARALRYASFQQHLPQGARLLLAHHQDDQAETLLLQLLRGAGVKGLAAMPQEKLGESYTAYRPFLSLSKKEIEAYASAHGLVWHEDESNQDTQFARNYLRHKVMPLLKQNWPSASVSIARSASLCAEADEVLSEYTLAMLEACLGANNTLNVSQLLALSNPKQRLVLRAWIDKAGFPLPSAVKLTTLQQTVLHAAEDAMPLVAWQGAEVRRFNGNIYMMSPQKSHDVAAYYDWDLAVPLELNHLEGCLSATSVLGDGVLIPERARVTIRFRQGGEVMVLPGFSGHRPLKKLFQEWQVPPWLRDRVPLLYVGNELIMVVGYAIADGYRAGDGQLGWCIEFQH